MRKIRTKLTGSKNDGYTLLIENDTDHFYQEVQLKHDELIAIRDLLNKKIK